jgi:DNA-binding MarR family transcriptional regulator
MKSSVSPPDPNVYRWVGYVLKRAQHAMRASIDTALRDIGLNIGQYAVLEALGEGSSITNVALARRCFVRPQTANQLIAALVASGAVERDEDAFRGRAVGLTLSLKGRRLLTKARALVGKVESRMLRDMNEAEREQLAQLLTRCAESLEGS